MLSRRRFLQLAAANALATGLPGAMAEGAKPFSQRPVNWIVPFRAGGGTDQFARILQTRSEHYFGRRALIQNRGGASGTIGWRHVLTPGARWSHHPVWFALAGVRCLAGKTTAFFAL